MGQYKLLIAAFSTSICEADFAIWMLYNAVIEV
jgi:hypothetical protein